jgi:hypothetical protein
LEKELLYIKLKTGMRSLTFINWQECVENITVKINLLENFLGFTLHILPNDLIEGSGFNPGGSGA